MVNNATLQNEPWKGKSLVEQVDGLQATIRRLSFAAIANSLNPPVSKQYVHKLFWKAIENLNRERRERAEKWRAIVEACERMDQIDPPP